MTVSGGVLGWPVTNPAVDTLKGTTTDILVNYVIFSIVRETFKTMSCNFVYDIPVIVYIYLVEDFHP